MASHALNVKALYERLDQVRKDAEKSWREVAREAGLASSTLTRIGHGGKPDANALVSLLAWLEMDSGLEALIAKEAPDGADS